MSALNRVVTWCLENLDPWLQDAARRSLVQEDGISETDFNELTRLAFSAFDIPVQSAVPQVKPLDRSSSGTAQVSDGVYNLLSIETRNNVNQIEPGSKLEFCAPGLTVVFGKNGAGKSGFARVLKRACNARDTKERILPDVVEGGEKDSASATLTLRDPKGEEVQVPWRDDGSPANPHLNNIAVFDARSSRVLTDDENSLFYIPYGTDVFSNLTKVINYVKDAAIERRPDIRVPEDSKIGESTSIGKWVAGISHKTEDSEIEKFCIWTDKNSRELKEARSLSRELEADNPEKRAKAYRAQAETIKSLSKELMSCLRLVDSGSEEWIVKTLRERDSYKRAHRELVEKMHEPDLLAGTAVSDEWQALYKAAEQFSIKSAYPESEFPQVGDGARCVLCQQPISEEAAERFKSFRQFMSDETRRQLDRAHDELSAFEETLKRKTLPPEENIIRAFESVGDLVSSELAESVKGYRSKIESRRKALLQKIGGEDRRIEDLSDNETIKKIDGVVGELERRARDLESSESNERRREVRRQLDELEARYALSRKREEVKRYRDNLSVVKKFNALNEDIAKTKRIVTNAAKDLVNEEVTPDLVEALQRECEELGWNRTGVGFRFKGAGGEAVSKMALESASPSERVKLSEILSEGEQRVIGIAGFLSEITLSEIGNPIVFDDPISSLDHEFSRRVAQRLAKEASERQVIIFTHDLVMINEIQSAMSALWKDGIEVKCSYATVSRRPRPGTVREGLPWVSKNVGSRANALQEELARIKSLYEEDEEQYQLAAGGIYARLREAWEALVERELLGYVVARHRMEVKTQTLWEVKVDDQDIVKVDKAMSKASEFMIGHDRSMALDQARPAPDEIREDIEELAEFAQSIKKRRVAVRKQRESVAS